MEGRVYTETISGIASPAAQFDMFEFVGAAAKPVRLMRLRIGQTSEQTSEEEQLALSFVRGHTTSGSGGDATPDGGPAVSTDTAKGYTAETMNTTIASGGTAVNCLEDAWNTRAGYDMSFSPEEVPWLVNGERGVVRIGAPADAITIRATAWLEEMG